MFQTMSPRKHSWISRPGLGSAHGNFHCITISIGNSLASLQPGFGRQAYTAHCLARRKHGCKVVKGAIQTSRCGNGHGILLTNFTIPFFGKPPASHGQSILKWDLWFPEDSRNSQRCHEPRMVTRCDPAETDPVPVKRWQLYAAWWCLGLVRLDSQRCRCQRGLS